MPREQIILRIKNQWTPPRTIQFNMLSYGLSMFTQTPKSQEITAVRGHILNRLVIEIHMLVDLLLDQFTDVR